MTRSILLVDQDPKQRAPLLRALDGNGVRVVGEAAKPDEAMRLAATAQPNVALVAITPGNEEAIRLVDRLDTELGIPSILLVEAADQPPFPQVTKSGVIGLLVQPVDPAIVHAMLDVTEYRCRDILALRREGEALRRALEDRKVVERGKGLLMEMENISEQEAFARIRQKRMDTRRSMAEIARAIMFASGMNRRSR